MGQAPQHSRRIELVLAAIALAAVAGVLLVAARLGRQVEPASVPPAETLNPDIEALRKVDPALVRWRETARWETGFAKARGLALGADGRVYVAGDRAVRVFSAAGVRQAEIALDGEPTCVAAGANVLYVGLRDHVELYAQDGKRLASWEPRGARAYFTSLAPAGDGVWAADVGNRVVLRYSATGEVVQELGKRDDARYVPGLVVPSPHLDVAPPLVRSASDTGGREALWVSDPGRRRLEVYGKDGDLLSSWGSAGIAIDRFSGCCNPTDFALLPGGGFVTSEKGIPRVKEYDASGQFVSVVAGPESFAQNAVGIDLAAGRDGRVWVLDPAARAVRVYVKMGASDAPAKTEQRR
jgi:hypothetical protein